MFDACFEDTENESSKTELLNYYYSICDELKNNPTLYIRKYSNLLAIKNMLSSIYEEVESITTNDIETVYNYIISAKYLTHYDYNILMNISRHFTKDQADKVLKKAFPIADVQQRPLKTLSFAYGAIKNLITARIYELDFETAGTYISYAMKQNKELNNQSYKMTIQYLNNLVEYADSGKSHHLRKLFDYISALEDIGDFKEANTIKEEIYRFTHKNSKDGKISELWTDEHYLSKYND